MALRKLRRFARRGAPDRAGAGDTIDATARSGGWLDIKMVPERHNVVKVLLLLDVGGSMDDHVKTCEELFSAARSEFKHLEHFYFHNFTYEALWRDNRGASTSTSARRGHAHLRLRLQADPGRRCHHEPLRDHLPGGSVEHWNAEPGSVWLQRLMGVPEVRLDQSAAAGALAAHALHRNDPRDAGGRMYPLTLAGLDDAIDALPGRACSRASPNCCRGSGSPFPVITGTSAGAVSAIALASDPAHFRHAVYAIERVWRDFRVHQVFKADAVSVLRSGLHWMLALVTGGWLVHPPHSLFDNTPLWDLLRRASGLRRHTARFVQEASEAVGICATSYADADSVTFYACASAIEPVARVFRKGARVQLTWNHLMASLSIPFLFRPIFLHDQYFGDGAMRQTSPLSPAIHLGANRLFWSSAWATSQPGLGPRTAEAGAHVRADVRLHAGLAVHGSAARGSRAHQALQRDTEGISASSFW
jgi:predicted acylesterase/phospholipase RssA